MDRLHLYLHPAPPPTFCGGVRGSQVENQNFHCHSAVMTPYPLPCQWELCGEPEPPSLPNNNEELIPITWVWEQHFYLHRSAMNPFPATQCQKNAEDLNKIQSLTIKCENVSVSIKTHLSHKGPGRKKLNEEKGNQQMPTPR